MDRRVAHRQLDMMDGRFLLAAIVQDVGEKAVGVGAVGAVLHGAASGRERRLEIAVQEMDVAQDGMGLTVAILQGRRPFGPLARQPLRLLPRFGPAALVVVPMGERDPGRPDGDIAMHLRDPLEVAARFAQGLAFHREESVDALVEGLQGAQVLQRLVPDPGRLARDQFDVQGGEDPAGPRRDH